MIEALKWINSYIAGFGGDEKILHFLASLQVEMQLPI